MLSARRRAPTPRLRWIAPKRGFYNKTEIIFVEPPQRGRCKGCKWGAGKGEGEEQHRSRPPISHTRPCARAPKNALGPRAKTLFAHAWPPRAPLAPRRAAVLKHGHPGRRLWGVGLAYAAGPKPHGGPTCPSACSTRSPWRDSQAASPAPQGRGCSTGVCPRGHWEAAGTLHGACP